MLGVLQLLMGILLALSFLGYVLLTQRTLGIAREFVPVFVFSAIACVVYLSGLAGVLLAGSIVVMVGGLLALGLLAMRGRRAGSTFRLSLFQGFFLAGSLMFFVLLAQCNLTHYDNFSHWAIVLKQMLSTDAFPAATAQLIDFKNYPLGISSFLYYVCRFAGHAQPVMLLAQGMLIFSCFYAMFGIISEKKRFLLYAFLGLGASALSMLNITIRISNLLVDFLLPLYTLAIFVAVYQYRTDIRRACLVTLPLAGLLTVIKSTGIIFAGIGLFFLLYTWMRHRQKPAWKGGLAVSGTLCGALLPYFGWSWRMRAVFQGVENKFDVSASDLPGLQTAKTPDQMREIIRVFFSASTDLATRPVIGIVMAHILAIAACIFAAVILKRKWKLWKALLALDVVLLAYYAGILGLYLYSMPLDEALWLAGFERYASSIVVLFVGGLVLCATVDIQRSFHYRIGEAPSYRAFKSVDNKNRYQKGILACMAVAITLLISEYNGITSIAQTYQDTLPGKVQAITGDRWYKNGEMDESRYLFYASDADEQVTSYYMQYAARYFLYAPSVDGICLFYEDNMDHLLSGYDYLAVVEGDLYGNYLLKKHYGVAMQEGIYKITHSGGRVSLALL